MKRLAAATFAALAVLTPAFAQGQSDRQPPISGAVTTGAPVDVFLEVRTGANGEPILSAEQFTLALGGYYRFNYVCPDARDDSTGFHFEITELLSNSHLRVMSVNDIEFYMQGLTFRAIECDEAGAARFSFHPMRRGVYDIYVRDHKDPPQEAFAKVIVE